MSGVHEGLHADVERDCERRNVLVYLPQGQTLQLLLPEDMTRLRIQELVAQRLGFETSQIRLVDSVQPPPAGLCLQVEVRANDYAMEMNSWPRHPLKQELIVFVQENLDMRSLPTTPDKTWPVLSFMRTGCVFPVATGARGCWQPTRVLCPHMDSLQKQGPMLGALSMLLWCSIAFLLVPPILMFLGSIHSALVLLFDVEVLV